MKARAPTPPSHAASPRHRRPGTAVSHKGRATSESVLDAATQLLIDEGYAQLSTRKIAARAGIRPGNLQYYYPAKQDVIRALLERYLTRSFEAIGQRVAASAGTTEIRLRSCLEGILAEQASPGACRIFWEIWALAARDRSVARATRSFYRRYRDAVCGLLVAAAPGLGAARAARRATLIVAMLEGLTVFRLGAPRLALEDALLARELPSLAVLLIREEHP